ncbi:heterokaryon incompatibility protein 6, OR allele [Cladorrhinum sp. PSN259]|nr:heterokaryon incompatibility protein 6, OR allele [Cladorrhinum sp. PSN259]
MNRTTLAKIKAIQSFSYSSTFLDEHKTEFRLLELFPPSPAELEGGDGDAFSTELTCRIFVTTVNNPSKPYKALSYVWGDDTKTHRILVRKDASDRRSSQMRGLDTDAQKEEYLSIPLTKSLFIALHNLRASHDFSTSEGGLILWIDQICINQDDLGEKAHQVGLMGKIYSSASEVLVWLGPAEHNSDAVMQAWRSVGQASRDLDVESYFTKERYPAFAKAMNTSAVDPENDQDEFTREYHRKVVRKAAEMFPPLIRDMLVWFKRPWFTRAWTVQEFCLCPETYFVCGKERLPAEFVHLGVFGLHSSIRAETIGLYTTGQGLSVDVLNEVLEPPTNRLFHCRTRRQKFEKKVEGATGDGLLTLLRKLYVGRDVTQATEHRDRIYSLLGLAVDAEALNIKPEYSGMRDYEVESRILTDAARAMITNKTSGMIETLCFAQFPKMEGLGDHLPTWVPDWRTGLKSSFYEINVVTEEHIFAACGDQLDVESVLHSEPNVLGLRGYLVGAIEAVTPGDGWTPTRYEADRWAKYMTELGGLVNRAIEKDSINPEDAFHIKSRREESCWRVPTGDLFWTPEKEKHRAGREAAGQHFQRYMHAMMLVIQAYQTEDEATKEEKLAKFREMRNNQQLIYWQSMEYTEGKKPFLTRNGYIGMGPAEAREGDVVVVFCGGRIPFVLRPVPFERFQFIGEAFCDGIMDGEIVTKVEGRNFFLV